MSAAFLVIVSGGQTGADRGALDAALEGGLPCSGWCPRGRRAEDGAIPARYPLRETDSADYADRTRRNVRDSDGTLVLGYAGPGPGTELTIEAARRLARPLLVIDVPGTPIGRAIADTCAFLRAHDIRRLNVAGPRASEQPTAYAYARQLVACVIAKLGRATGRRAESAAAARDSGIGGE